MQTAPKAPGLEQCCDAAIMPEQLEWEFPAGTRIPEKENKFPAG